MGKVELWGETVLLKDVASFKHKGEPVYRKGVWVGKSSSDGYPANSMVKCWSIVQVYLGSIQCRAS